MSMSPMPSPNGTNKARLYVLKDLAQAAPSPRHGLVRDEVTPVLRRKLAENLFAEMREYEERTMKMNRPKRMSDIASYVADQTLSKRRRARDEYDSQDLQDLIDWVVENCSPEEMASIVNALRKRIDASAARDDLDLSDKSNPYENVTGDPSGVGPHNSNKPSFVRGQGAQDAAFFRRFPEARRIVVDHMGAQSNHLRQRPGAAGDFFRRYPDAARIKVL
jgi:hypothetical protein